MIHYTSTYNFYYIVYLNDASSGAARVAQVADDDIHYRGKRFPQPLSALWRLYHFLLYINGG
jgi:hypothetical protein